MHASNINIKQKIEFLDIITIIVIIILALAVILSINKNNPIENARVAKEKNNEETYQEELLLYIGNEYVNNHEFNQENINAYTKDTIEKIITSMPEEDAGKYVIAQGELAKLDEESHTYKNIKGEEVKLLDDETVLTEYMVEFAKEIEKAGLLYNGGYVSNCYNMTVAQLKEKLPSGIKVMYSSSNDNSNMQDTQDNWKLGTNFEMYYKENLVARFVVFGDINGDADINSNDKMKLQSFLNKAKNDYIKSFFISADVDHNGVIDEIDMNLIMDFYQEDGSIEQNIIPKKTNLIK